MHFCLLEVLASTCIPRETSHNIQDKYILAEGSVCVVLCHFMTRIDIHKGLENTEKNIIQALSNLKFSEQEMACKKNWQKNDLS